MKNGIEMKWERFFMRMVDPNNGEVFYDECEGFCAFEVNGFRFFFCNGIITDAFSGHRITSIHWTKESPEQCIKRSKEMVLKHFDHYLKEIKKSPRPKWKRQGQMPEWVRIHAKFKREVKKGVRV